MDRQVSCTTPTGCLLQSTPTSRQNPRWSRPGSVHRACTSSTPMNARGHAGFGQPIGGGAPEARTVDPLGSGCTGSALQRRGRCGMLRPACRPRRHSRGTARRTRDDETFRQWGLWTGTVWSEESEGTNGIGTCLVERRTLTIHRDQHFHSRNTLLSCTTAPVYDHEGNLAAALDVSSCRPT